MSRSERPTDFEPTRFAPYPELVIEPAAAVGEWRLTTPWVELEIEASAELARRPELMLAQLFDYDLGFALPREAHDPLTAFTEIRREALLEQARLARAADPERSLARLLDRAEAESATAFARVAALALRQSWHVTVAAPPAIFPAVRRFPQLAPLLRAYLADEAGHDALMAQSLAALGVDAPRTLRLLPAARRLTQLLAASARTNPLALACLIAGFEGQPSSEHRCLFAERLARGPFPAAARGVATHAKINGAHQHAAVGKHMSLAIGTTVEAEHIGEARRMALALEAAKRELDEELYTECR